MVDFQTQNKHQGYRYNVPERRHPEASFRDLYRDAEPVVFKAKRVEKHDCRVTVMQDYTDKRLWEASLFARGMQNTCQGVESMHKKESDDEQDGDKVPDRLLYDVGRRGKGKGELDFPRSVACSEDGNIWVADTRNHRVQRFNECGLYVSQFGEKGAGDAEFLEPTGVAVLPGGRVVVADRKLKSFKVFSAGGRFKHAVRTKAAPYFVACDDEDNVVVSTVKKTIEVYRRQGTYWKQFPVAGACAGEKFAPCPVAVNGRREVVVCDRAAGRIRFYSYEGAPLYDFEPVSALPGLATVPSSVCLNPAGDVLVADSLNHAVNLYSERGKLIQQLLCPTDDAGALQAISVGPQGNLVAAEYTLQGPHCLKVFRYLEIEGRPVRPGSSKRTTPTPTPTPASARSSRPSSRSSRVSSVTTITVEL